MFIICINPDMWRCPLVFYRDGKPHAVITFAGVTHDFTGNEEWLLLAGYGR